MDRNQLIKALEKALESEELSVVAASALSAVRDAPTISILDEREKGASDRRRLLGIYLLRQRRLKANGGKVEGFDETIACLGKCESSRIHGISVNLGERFLNVLTEPAGNVVGCFFLERPVDSM
jgi:hypothetical protein